MIGSDQTLNIVIKAKDDASATLDKFKGNVENLQPTFKKMAAVGAVAFTAIAAGAYKMFQAYSDAEAQTTITNQALSNSFENLSKKDLGGLQKALGSTQDALKGLQGEAQKAGAAAVKLGFDDEAAAGSFAKLFAVTKNVTKANSELTLAMDLARYKGISLEDATQKLIMVHSGATKELKLMGIAVDDNATAEQNLEAIRKQAGQTAEEYAKTTKGAMEIINVEVGNLQESIGAALAPAFTKLLETVKPVIERFAAWAEANPDLLAKIILVAGAIAGLVAVVGTLGMALPAIIGLIGGVGTALTFLAANPIVLVVAAFVGLIAILDKIIQRMKDLKGISASAAESAAQVAKVNENLAAKIATTTDPVKKAKFEAALAQGQEGQKTLESVANAGFFKNLAVGLGISKYEHGGMVPGATGQEVPIIAHGGETIIPAGQSSRERGDTVYNFTFMGTVAGDEGIKKIIKDTIRVVDRASSLRATAGA